MNCEACGKFHWGCCLDKTIPISKRMKAGQVVDGDRSSDAPWRREPVNANEFAEDVKALESLLAAVITAAEPLEAWLTQKAAAIEKLGLDSICLEQYEVGDLDLGVLRALAAAVAKAKEAKA